MVSLKPRIARAEALVATEEGRAIEAWIRGLSDEEHRGFTEIVSCSLVAQGLLSSEDMPAEPGARYEKQLEQIEALLASENSQAGYDSIHGVWLSLRDTEVGQK